MKYILLIICVASITSFCFGQKDISMEEAILFQNIENLENEKIDEDYFPEIGRLYSEYSGKFESIILLNVLMNLNQVEIIGEVLPKDLFVLFSNEIINQTEQEFLKKQDKNSHYSFLLNWSSFRYAIDSSFRVDDSKATLNSFAKTYKTLRSKELSVQELYKILENWSSPIEYEIATCLIIEKYKQGNTLLKESIKHDLKSYLQNNIPSHDPPPFTRKWTNFQNACLLAKSLGGNDLLIFLTNINSNTENRTKSLIKDCYSWIDAKVEYPYKYRRLYLTFPN